MKTASEGRSGALALAAAAALTGFLVLSGCDAFLAGKLGRYNPNDPANELVEFAAPVVIDGWFDSASTFDTSMPDLPVGTSSMRYSLIKFDLSAADVPGNVVAATLYLTTTPGSGMNTTVFVYPIIRDWDFPGLSWSQINDPGGFYDATYVSATYVEGTLAVVREYSWDLGGFFRAAGAGGFHGVMISQAMTPENFFFASENGTNGPRLVLQGYTP